MVEWVGGCRMDEDASFEEVALPGGCCTLTAREAGATDLEGFPALPPELSSEWALLRFPKGVCRLLDSSLAHVQQCAGKCLESQERMVSEVFAIIQSPGVPL